MCLQEKGDGSHPNTVNICLWFPITNDSCGQVKGAKKPQSSIDGPRMSVWKLSGSDVSMPIGTGGQSFTQYSSLRHFGHGLRGPIWGLGHEWSPWPFSPHSKHWLAALYLWGSREQNRQDSQLSQPVRWPWPELDISVYHFIIPSMVHTKSQH